MAKKKKALQDPSAVRDMKGSEEKTDPGKIQISEGNIGRLTVGILSNIVTQLKRIADALEKNGRS